MEVTRIDETTQVGAPRVADAPGFGTELQLDELEHVVGGLERAMITPMREWPKIEPAPMFPSLTL